MIKLLNKLSTIISSQVNSIVYKLPFDKQCQLCKTNIATIINNNICQYCNRELARLVKLCPLCSWPIPANMHKCDLCIDLLLESDSVYKHGWTDIKILFPYSNPIDKIIHQFKYFGDLSKGRLLADLFLSFLQRELNSYDNFMHNNLPLPEVIIPVPLYKDKLKQRGFNQGIELAKYLSKQLEIPFDANLIAKFQPTDSQMSLDKAARCSNLENSFCLNRRAKYRSAVIIDDVVTTGSTAVAIAKLLQKTNIKNISLWAIARRC